MLFHYKEEITKKVFLLKVYPLQKDSKEDSTSELEVEENPEDER